MNVDPLADTVPPRHLYESDDEDEPNPLPTRVRPSADAAGVTTSWVGNLPTGKLTLVACGDAGRAWARGADLGEQAGALRVNDVQVGMLFQPAWYDGVVLVSEATTTLPIWAMHPYARAIFDGLKPSRLAVLDTYPIPAYISQEPVSAHDAPIRYLGLSPELPKDASIQLFEQPNLLQSTSAAILSIAALPPFTHMAATLLLLPSPQIPRAKPATLVHSSYDMISHDATPWPAEMMRAVSSGLLLSLGVQSEFTWKENVADAAATRSMRLNRRSDVGEGGMYI